MITNPSSSPRKADAFEQRKECVLDESNDTERIVQNGGKTYAKGAQNESPFGKHGEG